jgi:hypothetical protein
VSSVITDLLPIRFTEYFPIDEVVSIKSNQYLIFSGAIITSILYPVHGVAALPSPYLFIQPY